MYVRAAALSMDQAKPVHIPAVFAFNYGEICLKWIELRYENLNE